MYVYVNFKFSASNEEELKRAEDFFASRGYETSTVGTVLFADGEREDYRDDKPIESFFMRKAYHVYLDFSSLIDHDFVFDGTIDTSFAAGEYMDFRFERSEGKTKCYCSDYYLLIHKMAYSYEDFHDEFGDRYSRDFYDGMTDKDYYAIREEEDYHLEYNIIVDEVPLKPISIEAFIE